MEKISKVNILKMLSSNLEFFYPELKDHFLCPTCLTAIPLTKKEMISEAHIIPKKAKGKLKIYLCKECNNFFGSKQDKWFGELIKLSIEDATSIFATDLKDGYFWIDNIRVNGHWVKKQNGSLSFYIHKDRNSPEINELMKRKFGLHPPSINLSLSFPLLRHEKMIDIGFLTAGYLMWFGALGYSWVLQSHLNIIREQILNPEKEILKKRYIAYCNKVKWQPWVGLVTISNEISLTMGLENTFVLFPPMDQPELYSKLGNDFNGKVAQNIYPLQFWKKPYYGEPVCLAFDNRMLVAPNAIMDKGLSYSVIHFISGRTEAILCWPISTEEFDNRIKTSETIIKKYIDTTHVERHGEISIKKYKHIKLN